MLNVIDNDLAMTAEQAYKKYGSWEVVLEKAMSANAGMDACCGLYDKFHHIYSVGGIKYDSSYN